MNRKREPSRDWTYVVAQIRGRHKIRSRKIAEILGISFTALTNLSTGRTKEPLYGVGVRLLELLERGK